MKNKQISILIVDSNALTREKLGTFLASEYRCTTAATAEESIRLLTFCLFDLVITERELPGVSGLELCQFVQKTRPDTAVILISESITPWHRTVAERLGAFDCIRRPYKFLSLPDLIESALLSKAHKNEFEFSKSAESVYQTA